MFKTLLSPGCYKWASGMPSGKPAFCFRLPSGNRCFLKNHLRMIGKLCGKMFGKLLNKQSGKWRIESAKQRHMHAGTYYTNEAARSRRDCRDSQNIPRTMDCIRTTASVQQKTVCVHKLNSWTSKSALASKLSIYRDFAFRLPSGYLPVTMAFFFGARLGGGLAGKDLPAKGG